MVTSRVPRSGASVGVSISTQRRMPSSMVRESNGFEEGIAVAFVIRRNDGLLQMPGAAQAKTVSAAVGLFVAAADQFDHVDDGAAQLDVGDEREGADQRKSVGGREEIGDVSRRGRFVKTIRVGSAGRALEQERYRDLKDFGDLVDAAGADAVGAFLIFLDLLECQPPPLPQ